MDNQSSNNKSLDLKTFQDLEATGSFDITPCDRFLDFDDSSRFSKLKLEPTHKSQINAIMQQVPLAMAASTMAGAYTVRFPEGLPHTLTALKQGGFGSMIQGDNGQFVGTASFYDLASQAMLLNVFTAMSVATGQYFLSQINSELNIINQKIDKILDFLYGDKKAELMSEVSFTKHAYQNFTSIMCHEQQRIATLISLQQSRKIAMKDIEFYMSDLNSCVNREAKSIPEFERTVDEAFQLKKSIETSVQLYIMSSIMEIYFAQNYDEEYIKSLDADMTSYIDKSEKRVLSSFTSLSTRINEFKGLSLKKLDKTPLIDRLDVLIDSLNSGEKSEMHKLLHSALYAPFEKSQYYIYNGDMYVKTLEH